jgi:hypothetical protein
LLEWFWGIRGFLSERLFLRLKEEVKLLPLSNGADFLGYIVKPWSVFVRKRVINNFNKKIVLFKKSIKECPVDNSARRSFASTKASYFGHFKHADSFKLKKKFGECLC